MEEIAFGIIGALNILLTVLTVQRIIAGAWLRHYYLLAALLIVNLLSAVPAMASFLSLGDWSLQSAHKLYWILEFLSQTTIYFFVLQFTYRVGQELPAGRRIVGVLAVIAPLLLVASFVIHIDHRLNRHMSSVIRDLTFMAASMNMILWRFLLQLKKKDFLLLTISAGLGIQCTGQAIGLSVRYFGESGHNIGNVLLSITSLVTIGIWHLGFSKGKRALEKRRPPGSPSTRSGPRQEKPEEDSSIESREMAVRDVQAPETDSPSVQ